MESLLSHINTGSLWKLLWIVARRVTASEPAVIILRLLPNLSAGPSTCFD